ncbi:E3 ubiquitin-protein ligase FANCL [Maniola jurtina]|uniref:E3 ubiquitin-protein ligase FANCL n=1 Tax=Maniola jurtina TaxID=191418 RepID=UPI001E6872A7|nr:E3 ubiquitin-protein ligase FANCL [Maniola jurtina]
MKEMDLINELLNAESCNSMHCFMNLLHKYYAEKPVIPSQNLTSDLIDKELIDEIEWISRNISVSFGKSLKDLKCCLMDEEDLREHEIYLRYKSHHKLTITDVKLPYSPHQDREYSSINEVVTVFRNYIESLTAYFQELENIDKHCTVVEPLKPTFKDDYRRILLDCRTQLHIEVTPVGSARNIHLIGQSGPLNDKLHTGLLTWDHDRNIVENINCIFDLDNIPQNQDTYAEQLDNKVEGPSCNICFCVHLAECQGLPQPLCQNPKCDVYYHKYCLFQWLVACEGGRPPAFGVAYGSCPTCLQPISCSES